MKDSLGKSHVLLSNKKTEKVKINNVVLTSSVAEKLLGISLHSELKFEKNIIGICNKASQKIHVLSRITSYMSLNKWRLLVKTFVLSQFNYCPLIWMFHSRRLINKINNVHEKALRMVYSDYKSTFRNSQIKTPFSQCTTEIFKLWQQKFINIFMGFHQQLWWKFSNIFNILQTQLTHNLRTHNEFSTRFHKTVKER